MILVPVPRIRRQQVVRRLLSHGLEVAAMVRDASAAGERLSPRVTLRVADDENISALRSALAGADDRDLKQW